MRTFRIVAILVSLLAAAPAPAVFLPGIQKLSRDQVEAERKLSFTEWTWESLKETLRTPVGGLALSADYHYGTQDFQNTSLLGKTTSESRLNTFSLRPEFVVSNWLSLYGIAALHDGHSRSSTKGVPDVDLDGWAAGMGVTASLGLPPIGTTWFGEDVSLAPVFVVPDFNWTHNDFQGVDNGVEVVNVTTRIGTGGRTDTYNWAIWAGPAYQNGTSALTVSGLHVSSEPTRSWSAVLGIAFGIRLVNADEDNQLQRRRDLLRPTLLATIEGGAGNREGILLSLRYEYDLLGQLLR